MKTSGCMCDDLECGDGDSSATTCIRQALRPVLVLLCTSSRYHHSRNKMFIGFEARQHGAHKGVQSHTGVVEARVYPA
ncbi:hypothetical protein E2C01_068161 [Portunus trituberculatus]|uniref:Uncharacterized protein n=1 Tax=Portunus trituberculatus TaxID=210409 RepID=A0A5B7HR76_PORTR|nr:hypothetical protein [Portunus trituberculatus]